MSEVLDWQRLAALLGPVSDKVVVILPSGQTLILTSLEHYEALVKGKKNLDSLPIKNSLAPSATKKRGRPPKSKPVEPIALPQSKLGEVEEIGGLVGGLSNDDEYYPEPI
ncbi:hypothetical protein KKC17_01015 [Patescibacteria group bacterium]|nr:hypothetical protein [Patescibacteria group bacterium]